MSVYEYVGDALKGWPRAFDFAKRIRRAVGLRPDPLFRALGAYSASKGARIGFIQIGANDGLFNDPVREFVLDGQWTGIMVEPLPAAFRRLILNYSYRSDLQVSFVNCAISDSTSGALKLFTFDDHFLLQLPIRRQLSLLRKASVSRDHILRFATPREQTFIVSKAVPTLSFADLVGQLPAGVSPDVVIIDVEGHEKAVIRGIDLKAYSPDLIVYEAIHAGSAGEEIRALLGGGGYTVLECGIDNIAVRPEWVDVVQRAIA